MKRLPKRTHPAPFAPGDRLIVTERCFLSDWIGYTGIVMDCTRGEVKFACDQLNGRVLTCACESADRVVCEFTTCSWCHEPVLVQPPGPLVCPTCGHRADRPRIDCDCPKCRPLPVKES